MEHKMIERTKQRIKDNGEVFTPIELVHTMLDSLAVDWANPPLEKTWLDPTCGEGVFLLELARRGIPLHNLFGVDLMPDNIECLKIQLIQHFGDTEENVETVNNNIRCANAMFYDYSFRRKQ
jgi:type I restriction-modification system DNA methylase subunit